jgi:ParB-like chromosome segregation protein Spo0J
MAVGTIRSAVIEFSLVTPNPWNPNRMDAETYHKELASLRKFGYVNPIIVRPAEGEAFQVIDGEHRLKGMQELGHRMAMMTIVDGLTDADAKQLTIVLNETRGKPDPKKLGDLLADLLTDVPKPDLLDLLPLSPTQFDKLTGVEDFDWGALSTLPEEEKSSWVERTYRMPKDAASVLDDAIAAARDGDEGIADWQGIERIAADFLAGTR